MFEDKTYEAILQRMLDRVPDTVDKRQGSIIYDALAPAATELTQMYIELDNQLNLVFASTSSDKYLEMRTTEMGIIRQPATKAKKKGLFYGASNTPMDIPMGKRFSIDGLNYVAVSRLTLGEFVMECEIAGAIGNSPVGSMLPIEYINGLSKAELAEIVEEGIDEETDQRLLERYQLRVRQPTTSGNVYHYKQWALEVPGVGDAKIFPLWNGNGTVKIVIVDTEKQPASPTLIISTAEHIETVRPIGAEITVVPGIGKLIHAAAVVVLASGYTLQQVIDTFRVALEEYFRSIAFEMTYVSYAKIGTILLGVSGVIDYSNLTLNGTTANIALADEEIPILGTVELEV
ncbi:baseplate J/gp47 family protein [Geosporobacter ferrireducens]|uniref:baseplate J/gp47 family protein n=1 Tax=Geosporobacter ferrireducens TaxID=1424294 RepID=UPI00139DDF59|nr:baseplate J/gp47 family protein [Geosporobacter ferrireducens]MTI56165.1 baseplate J/gp47 family protein [Geosporobacter ferrireducens]